MPITRQVIMYFMPIDYERLTHKCKQERRSLTSQLRKLLEEITEDRNLLKCFTSNFTYQVKEASQHAERIKSAIKLPEEEYWEATRKSARGWMHVAPFCNIVLIAWANHNLSQLLSHKDTI